MPPVKQALRLVVNTIALWVMVAIVPGVAWPGDKNLVAVLGLALIFGVINTYIKPIIRLFSLPFRLLTLGLFGLAINAGMLLLLAWIGGQLDLGLTLAGWPAEPFSLEALVAALLGGLVLAVISTVLSVVIPD